MPRKVPERVQPRDAQTPRPLRSVDPSLSNLQQRVQVSHISYPGICLQFLVLIKVIVKHWLLGGNSQNFLCKFLIFFVTLGPKILRL